MKRPLFYANRTPAMETLQAIQQWPVDEAETLWPFVLEAWDKVSGMIDEDDETITLQSYENSNNDWILVALRSNRLLWDILCYSYQWTETSKKSAKFCKTIAIAEQKILEAPVGLSAPKFELGINQIWEAMRFDLENYSRDILVEGTDRADNPFASQLTLDARPFQMCRYTSFLPARLILRGYALEHDDDNSGLETVTMAFEDWESRQAALLDAAKAMILGRQDSVVVAMDDSGEPLMLFYYSERQAMPKLCAVTLSKHVYGLQADEQVRLQRFTKGRRIERGVHIDEITNADRWARRKQ